MKNSSARARGRHYQDYAPVTGAIAGGTLKNQVNKWRGKVAVGFFNHLKSVTPHLIQVKMERRIFIDCPCRERLLRSE